MLLLVCIYKYALLTIVYREQMLYGSRPYGEGKSQENVWSEGLIFNASQVEFPSDPKAPKVTDEAKDLIRACLTRDHRSRLGLTPYCVYL